MALQVPGSHDLRCSQHPTFAGLGDLSQAIEVAQELMAEPAYQKLLETEKYLAGRIQTLNDHTALWAKQPTSSDKTNALAILAAQRQREQKNLSAVLDMKRQLRAALIQDVQSASMSGLGDVGKFNLGNKLKKAGKGAFTGIRKVTTKLPGAKQASKIATYVAAPIVAATGTKAQKKTARKAFKAQAIAAAVVVGAVVGGPLILPALKAAGGFVLTAGKSVGGKLLTAGKFVGGKASSLLDKANESGLLEKSEEGGDASSASPSATLPIATQYRDTPSEDPPWYAQKIGPLPLWVWGATGVGVAAVGTIGYLALRRKRA